jgi:hypothetical protein
MAAQALSISQTPSLRFSPGQVVMTCGVDDLVQQANSTRFPTCVATSAAIGATSTTATGGRTMPR